ncbi:MAG: 2-hydroxychromene-2-carboxylate isomerase [Alphaproteobacteria bacterium]|jgi:2-hydroxychromene-2-carboxylate isomerase|nr:2-hydroxychromene-2-carboxylate isomerase [Alphaproteobacteria bacterium]MDP6567301.1 2-hydroxychromene-2-carboxylate isomerase [Alphaproteobacteria bacterium]MDP6811892.1 2-hydroxychromene-2-carboxylate isomerase [Alphaproteobacteria bacterium]
MPRLECFFDCSSPWTYLGFHNIQPLAAELGVEIGWRPILVGGLFNTVNPSVYHSREHPVPAKQRYMHKDLQDWARYTGIHITWPTSVFPVNSVRAMRGCIAAEPHGRLVPYARAAFEAYWGEDRDISQDEVLADVARTAELDPAEMAAAMAADEVKAALRGNTEELARRGGFGTPTFFVDGDDMYFGNDRMPLIRAALGS